MSPGTRGPASVHDSEGSIDENSSQSAVDAEFADVAGDLPSAVIGDILDAMGHYHQFLPQQIRPIGSAAQVQRVVGRAMPVLLRDVYGRQAVPFGRLTEALDQLLPGDVYIAAPTPVPCAAWGELLTAAARARGAAGAVIDGYHRDTVRVLEQQWPVFSRGPFAQDAGVRTSVVDYRVAVEIAGVQVTPGDLVVGDVDGVVLVPQHIEREVLELAQMKLADEGVVRAAIEAGMPTKRAWDTYGVL